MKYFKTIFSVYMYKKYLRCLNWFLVLQFKKNKRLELSFLSHSRDIISALCIMLVKVKIELFVNESISNINSYLV